jgi:hypothetical protein
MISQPASNWWTSKIVDMKQKLLLPVFLLLFASTAAFAQSVRVYAYSRETNGGMKPSDVAGENGSTIKTEKRPSRNYLIYLSYSGPTLKITGIWLNQKAYAFKTETTGSPVEIKENNAIENSKTVTLVPKTRNKVLVINPSSVISGPALSGPKKKAVADSDLVITYTINGKSYYKAIKKIMALPPVQAS